jgi:hypothetical protein
MDKPLANSLSELEADSSSGLEMIRHLPPAGTAVPQIDHLAAHPPRTLQSAKPGRTTSRANATVATQ